MLERVENTELGKTQWLCQCDCGEYAWVLGDSLHSRNTRSCGCLRKENAQKLQALPEGEAAFNQLIRRMKEDTKTHDREWQLTKEQVHHLTEQSCSYCGARPTQTVSTPFNTGFYIYNGLDRVDNTKGYTIDNVVPCCKTCNFAKGTMTLEEFKSWAINLCEHLVR